MLQEFTALALAHYVAGERSKMAEGMTADLAVIKLSVYQFASNRLESDSMQPTRGLWCSCLILQTTGSFLQRQRLAGSRSDNA